MTLPVFKPSKRTIILLAAIAGVILCIGGFGYYMCWKSLTAVNADCQQKLQQVADSKKTADRLKSVRSDFLVTQGNLSCLETSVTTKEYVPTMLKQLEFLAKSLNLRVVAVRPQPLPPPPPAPIAKPAAAGDGGGSSGGPAPAPAPTPAAVAKGYEELPIDVEVEGSYWNARNFISRLTQFPKIIAVKQIEMTPADAIKRMGSPALHVRLRLNAFVFPAKSEDKLQPKPAAPKTVPSSASASQGGSHNEG